MPGKADTELSDSEVTDRILCEVFLPGNKSSGSSAPWEDEGIRGEDGLVAPGSITIDSSRSRLVIKVFSGGVIRLVILTPTGIDD